MENLFRKRREEINSEVCKTCIKHVRCVEETYWETDRTIDEKVNRFIISVGGSEDQSDIDTDDLSTDEGDRSDV